MTPITTQTEQQHQYQEEIELQEMEMEDEAERLSPLTQSASSTLRDDLARFQQQELRRFYMNTRHRKPAAARTMQQPNDCLYPGLPPMAQPTTPPQPTEPAPDLSTPHRRRMDMRVNLPPTEDQPPRKISRHNSRADQTNAQSTSEARDRPQRYISTRDPQGHETEVHETSFPPHQQPQRQLQAEAMEQANEDNIPELFKTIANKKI